MNGTFRVFYIPEIYCLDGLMRGSPSRHSKMPSLTGCGGGGACQQTDRHFPRPAFTVQNPGTEEQALLSLTMAIEVQEFPKTEAYVDVAILDGGGMIGSSSLMHAEGPPTDINMSCWVFYIQHPTTGKKLIWDVGISAVYPSRNAIDGVGSERLWRRGTESILLPCKGIRS